MKTKTIVFLGSDGSGKTSLIKYTKKQLGKKYPVSIFELGWKNFQNPLLKVLSRIHLNSKNKKNIKEEKLARFRERSWFFYILYYLELWTRYIKILFSNKQVILIDRYFFDELAFAKGLKFKFFKLITPKPDLCFILKCPLEIIRKRKVYVSEKFFQNFYNHMNNLALFFSMVEVDTSSPVEKTFQQIKNKLIPLIPIQS